jgi:hypothetical protein
VLPGIVPGTVVRTSGVQYRILDEFTEGLQYYMCTVVLAGELVQ